MIERLSTGVDWLDQALQAGLPRNRVTLVVGEQGVGKTMLALNFCKAGLYQDEHVLWITTKDNPQKLFGDISSMGWDFNWALEQNRFFVVEARDYFSGITAEDLKTQLLQNFFFEIKRLIENNHITRVVIDPILPQSLFVEEDIYRYYMQQLIVFLEESALGVTTLILHTQFASSGVFRENLASNVLELFLQKQGENWVRSLFVRKMQQTPIEPKEFSFVIKPELGLFRV